MGRIQDGKENTLSYVSVKFIASPFTIFGEYYYVYSENITIFREYTFSNKGVHTLNGGTDYRLFQMSLMHYFLSNQNEPTFAISFTHFL